MFKIKKGTKLSYLLEDNRAHSIFHAEVTTLRLGIGLKCTKSNDPDFNCQYKISDTDLENGECLTSMLLQFLIPFSGMVHGHSGLWLNRQQLKKINEQDNIIENELMFNKINAPFEILLKGNKIEIEHIIIESEWMESDFEKQNIRAVFLNESNNPLLLQYVRSTFQKNNELTPIMISTFTLVNYE